MRKTLILFTTTALALLLAAGTAWAAVGAPIVSSTGTVTGTPPVTVTFPPTTGVNKDANITAKFSEPMSTKSLQILNHSTTTPPSTDSSNTFYLLEGNFTALKTTFPFKNPPRSCTTIEMQCPDPISATVNYDAGTLTATLNPTSSLKTGTLGTTYTAVVEGAGDGDKVAVKDTGSTPMAQDRIFSFTTAP
jgi:hypothetical protein